MIDRHTETRLISVSFRIDGRLKRFSFNGLFTIDCPGIGELSRLA
jgi:hypothetical protein